MSDHTLRGTIFVRDAAKAEELATDAARAYFGDLPFTIWFSANEVRTMGGQVLHYEVDYTAERKTT